MSAVPIQFGMTVWADASQLHDLRELHAAALASDDWSAFDGYLRSMIAEGPDVIELDDVTVDTLEGERCS